MQNISFLNQDKYFYFSLTLYLHMIMKWTIERTEVIEVLISGTYFKNKKFMYHSEMSLSTQFNFHKVNWQD